MAKVDLKVEGVERRGRLGWTAGFDRGRVLAAATVQRDRHAAKLDEWRGRLRAALEDRKKSERIETVHVTGGEQRTVHYDPGADAMVRIAEGRVTIHRDHLRVFKRWCRLLEEMHGASVEMTVEDVAVFFDDPEDDE